jgi:hypothetical protein
MGADLLLVLELLSVDRHLAPQIRTVLARRISALVGGALGIAPDAVAESSAEFMTWSSVPSH